MADFEAVAKQFVEFYYKAFDENRQQLSSLYRDNSMLTFESNAIQGVTGIIEKLTSLPFQKVRHQVATLDAQPTTGEGGILVMVTGALLTDDESRPMSYVQTFQLQQEPSGGYFVYNDMFKLVYPAA